MLYHALMFSKCFELIITRDWILRESQYQKREYNRYPHGDQDGDQAVE